MKGAVLLNISALIGLPLNYPTGDGLMKVQRSRDRHMRLDVSEACFLKRSVWSDVESVRLTEKAFEPKLLEIDIDPTTNTFSTDPLVPK